ncbi:MAG: ABC transporter permease [Pyrinomonadaceae bacterium]
MDNLVFSNMTHRPARTLVSIVGIGIGVLLIIFTVGLANGSLRDRARREANVGAEIMFNASGTHGLSGSVSLRLPVSLAGEIEQVEGVKTAVSIGQNTVSAKDNSFGTRLVDGVNFDEYAQIAGLEVIEGRKFTDGADEVMTDTAWLPQKNLKIGDTIKIYDRDFEIVGTYEPAAGGRVKIPLSTMQAQLGAEGKASTILVKVKDGFTADQVAQNLQAKFPDYQIILTSNLEELYMQSIPALNVFLNVVIGVAGGVSALIILLTMYTTVTERTRQIGVLKSLGMSNAGIAWVIVQEAILISFSGTILGILLTLILKIILTNWTTLTVQIEPQVVLIVALIGGLSGIVGALYPALRAAKLDAVEALSYE